MLEPDEEMLMAYADGALEPHQTAAVEAYIAANPHARKLVEDMRMSADLARQAFQAPMSAPPPDRLVATIVGPQPSGEVISAGAVASLIDFQSASARRSKRQPLPWLAAAASLALIAIGAAWYVSGGTSGGSREVDGEIALGPVLKGGELERVLETYVSGRTLDLVKPQAQGKAFKVVATFNDKSERICREVEVLRDTRSMAPISAGLACRSKQGSWQLEGIVKLGLGNQPTGPAYKPSGSSDRDALEEVLQKVGAGQALTAIEEKSLLDRKWQR